MASARAAAPKGSTGGRWKAAATTPDGDSPAPDLMDLKQEGPGVEAEVSDGGVPPCAR